MDDVEDTMHLDPAQRADTKEYILFCANYKLTLEVKC